MTRSLIACLMIFVLPLSALADAPPVVGADAPRRSLPEGLSSDPESWRSDRVCGVSAAYIFLRLSRVAVGYEQVRRAVSLGPKGSSMEDLRLGCGRLGFDARVVRLGPQELQAGPFPVVAHLFPEESVSAATGHFVVVVGSDETLLYVIDPSGEPTVIEVPKGDFYRLYSGFALVKRPANRALTGGLAALGVLLLALATQRLRPWLRRPSRATFAPRAALPLLVVMAVGSAAPGCDRPGSSHPITPARKVSSRGHWEGDILSVSSYEIDLGALDPLGENAAVFTITNDAPRPVLLELGMPSCTCTQATVTPETVPAGGTAAVRMVVTSKRKPGGLKATLTVAATGTEWSQTLTTRGFVVGAEFPDSVVADRAGKAEVVGLVYLRSPEDRCTLAVEKGDADHPATVRADPARIGEARSIYDDKYCVRTVTLPLTVTFPEGRGLGIRPLCVRAAVRAGALNQGVLIGIRQAPGSDDRDETANR